MAKNQHPKDSLESQRGMSPGVRDTETGEKPGDTTIDGSRQTKPDGTNANPESSRRLQEANDAAEADEVESE